MNRHELKARREALGLSQSQLADLWDFKQSALSQIENGKPAHNPRHIRPWMDEKLTELEDLVDALVDQAVEYGLAAQEALEAEGADDAVGVALLTHDTDESMWRAHPEMDGWPAVIHRVAMARARRELAAEGVDAIIAVAPAP